MAGDQNMCIFRIQACYKNVGWFGSHLEDSEKLAGLPIMKRYGDI